MWEDYTGQPHPTIMDNLTPTSHASNYYSGQSCDCIAAQAYTKDSEGKVWRCSAASNTPPAEMSCMYFHDPNGDSKQRVSLYAAINQTVERTIQLGARNNREVACDPEDESKGNIISAKWLQQRVKCNANGSISSFGGTWSPANGQSKSGYIVLNNECTGEGTNHTPPNPDPISGEDPVITPPPVVVPPEVVPPEVVPTVAAASCIYYDWVARASPYLSHTLAAGQLL